MLTTDDRLYCTLLCAEHGIDSRRLPSYMYLLQLFGFKLNFKYKVSYKKLTSNYNKYLNDLIATGYVYETKKKQVFVSQLSTKNLADMVINEDLYIEVRTLLSMLDKLSVETLMFICFTDFVIQEDLAKDSLSSEVLKKDRQLLENILTTLTSNFSDKLFYFSLYFLDLVRRHQIYEEQECIRDRIKDISRGDGDC